MNFLFTSPAQFTLKSITLAAKVDVLIAIYVISLCILLAFLLRRVFRTKLKQITSKTATELDDLFIKNTTTPLFWLVVLIGVLIGGSIVQLPVKPYNFHHIFKKTMETLIAIDLTWLVVRLIDLVEAYLYQLKQRTQSRLDDKILPVFRKVIKVFVIIIAGLMIIQNLGYSVTSLWAGLGIGGLAVALAARDTLANIFGAIVIFSDGLCRVGDRISVAGVKGTIEDIGFRSTKIRTTSQTLVTIPNSTLAKANVENLSADTHRAVTFSLTIPSATSPDEIIRLKQKILQTIARHSDVDKENVQVVLTDISSGGYTIQVSYLILQTEESTFLKIRDAIYLDIIKVLKESSPAG
ncbi:mechanosensitive ion channel family protein [Candidatus Sumerlaeota bacterium]|nr:mechanosensitive ion channel family protein [Candidatus Sumerlaeota bacterium]